jgi:HEAT repeat protein
MIGMRLFTWPVLAILNSTRNYDRRFVALIIAAACAAGIASTVPSAVAGDEEENDGDLRSTVKMLESEQPVQIERGIHAVFELGSRAEPAIPILISLLSDHRVIDKRELVPEGPPTISDEAGRGLRAVGEPAVPALVDYLSCSEDDKATRLAITALKSIGAKSRKATDVLLRLARTRDRTVRILAIDALNTVADRPEQLVPVLVAMLDDNDPNLKSAVLRSLGQIGRPAAPAIPQLLKLLDSDDVRSLWYTPDSAGQMLLCIDAADTLRKIGVPNDAVVLKLKTLLDHNDPYVRIAAAAAHARLSDQPSTGLGVLVDYLDERSLGYGVRKQAARSLGELGERARPVVDDLISLLQDEEVLVRCAAVGAITSIRPPGVFDILEKQSKDDDDVVRGCVYESVAGLVAQKELADVQPVIDLLFVGLDDPSVVVRYWAAEGLIRFRPVTEKAIRRLQKMAASGNRWDKDIAKHALDCLRSQERVVTKDQKTDESAEGEDGTGRTENEANQGSER